MPVGPGCLYQPCFSVSARVSWHGEASKQGKVLLRVMENSPPVHPRPRFPSCELSCGYAALEARFGEAVSKVRPALLLRRGRKPRANNLGGLGSVTACPAPPTSPLRRNPRLTFAFVAARSFSSHAFSTVAKASIAFQFFSRRSCHDHTHEAMNHAAC